MANDWRVNAESLINKGVVKTASRFESTSANHKETIILIRKISVLWLFYCQNRGVLPFFIGFIAKIEACRDSFCPCKPFSFLAVKYKSFNVYPFRSIYVVSFNLSLWIILYLQGVYTKFLTCLM